MARAEYTGSGNNFEELELGFQKVKLGAFGDNTFDPKKNAKKNDISWWFAFNNAEDQSKSSILSIIGSFNWENGKISTSKSFILAKVNALFDALGFPGGFNLDGELEDENGNQMHFDQFFAKYVEPNKGKTFCAYVYRNDTDTYTNLHYVLYDEHDMATFEKIIQSSIDSGLIKQLKGTVHKTSSSSSFPEKPEGSSIVTGKSVPRL